MEKMTIKKRSVLVILLLVIAVGIVVITSVNTTASEDEQGPALATMYKIQSESFQLAEALNGQSPYPQMYTHAQALTAFKGASPEEAAKEAANSYMERKALVWYARRQGIETTEAEFEQYLDHLIETVKATDDFPKLSAACAEAGLTAEDLYRKNREYYRDDFIIGKLYESWTKAYTNGKETISESESASMEEAWNQCITNAVASYKKSDAYASLMPAVKASETAYLHGAGTSVKKLEDCDIFISSSKSVVE